MSVTRAGNAVPLTAFECDMAHRNFQDYRPTILCADAAAFGAKMEIRVLNSFATHQADGSSTHAGERCELAETYYMNIFSEYLL